MEINFKINIPNILINNESNQNQAEYKIPDSFHVSYYIDFDCKNIPALKSSATSSSKKKIVLNAIEKKNDQRENPEATANAVNEEPIKEKELHPESERENEMANIGNSKEEINMPDEEKNEECYEAKDIKDIRNNMYREARDTALNLPQIQLVEKRKENDKGGRSDLSGDVNEDIYVMGIKDNISEEDLKALFSKYGEIADIKIFKDRFTKQYKGSGIIKFKNKLSSFKAINDGNDVVCKGCPLKLRYSRRSKIYGERDDRFKDGQKILGRIRERTMDAKEEGEIVYKY